MDATKFQEFARRMAETYRPGRVFTLREVQEHPVFMHFAARSMATWLHRLLGAGEVERISHSQYRVVGIVSAHPPQYAPRPKIDEAVFDEAEHRAWMARCATSRQQRRQYNPWERA